MLEALTQSFQVSRVLVLAGPWPTCKMGIEKPKVPNGVITLGQTGCFEML